MNFLFLSPIGWDNMDGAHRPVRFAAELARRGQRALYLQMEKSRVKPRAENLRVYDLAEIGMSEARVVAAFYGLDYGAMDESRAQLDHLLTGFETQGEEKIAIVSAPFRPFLEFLPGLNARDYKIVFDVHDDYPAMRSYYCYDALAEKYLAQNCDAALAVSEPLVAKMRAAGCPHIILLKNGVDVEKFRGRGAGAIIIERGAITLGFWGWIWRHNVDVDLLAQLARAKSQWQLHLLGPVEASIARELNFPNVHLHGQVARAHVPAYAENFDVCLLPSPNDAFNQARDPLKVYEYLACGKPVVATDQPQLADMPGVYCSRDADEFIANIERAARVKMDYAQVNEFLARQTWTTRVDELLRAVAVTPRVPRAPLPLPQGAMPGAETDAARWRAYARHLEKIVADREAHVQDLEHAFAKRTLSKMLGDIFNRTHK